MTAISRLSCSPASLSWKRLRSSMFARRSRKAPSASSPGSPTAIPYRLRALTTRREICLHVPAPPDPTDSSIDFNASRRQWATPSRSRSVGVPDTKWACASVSRSAARRPYSPNSTTRWSRSSGSSRCSAITGSSGQVARRLDRYRPNDMSVPLCCQVLALEGPYPARASPARPDLDDLVAHPASALLDVVLGPPVAGFLDEPPVQEQVVGLLYLLAFDGPRPVADRRVQWGV